MSQFFKRRLCKTNSILLRLLIPFIIIAIIQSMLFATLFVLTGIGEKSNQNEVDILYEKLTFSKQFFENELSRRSNLESILMEINDNTSSLLSALVGANILNLDKTYPNSGQNYPLSEFILASQCDDLISFMLRTAVDGAFIVLNDGQSTDGTSVNSGLSIRLDKSENPKSDNLEIIVAPPLAKSYLLETENLSGDGASPHFSLSPNDKSSDFFYKPLTAALNEGNISPTTSQYSSEQSKQISNQNPLDFYKNETYASVSTSQYSSEQSKQISNQSLDFYKSAASAPIPQIGGRTESEYGFIGSSTVHLGYWNIPNAEPSGDGSVFTYSIPLVHNFVVYGVFGIEITTDHLLKMLPYEEDNSSYKSSYFVAQKTEDESAFVPLFATGSLFFEVFASPSQNPEYPYPKIRIKNNTNYENLFVLDSAGDTLLACVTSISLYDDDSPFFSKDWNVVSIVYKSDLFSFSAKVHTLFVVLIIIVLFFGISAGLVTSVSISAPILRLTKKIRETQIQERITLDKCNIYELDQMVDEIIKLSDRLVEVERAEKARIELERDYDVLTNLLSRRAFMRRLSALEENPDYIKIAAMVVLDLDGLKEINDTYGHPAGDKYIRAGASSLKKFLGDNSLIGRMGGDEFTVLFYGYEDRNTLTAVINSLKEELQKAAVFIGEMQIKVRFSAGVAWYPKDSEDMETLFKYADAAMYNTKRSGKDSMQEYETTSDF